MIVSKFGGSCTTNSSALDNIKFLRHSLDKRKVFVFSAIGKEKCFDEKLTDLLISLCQQENLSEEYQKTKSKILSKFEKLLKMTNINFDIENAFSKTEKDFLQSKDKNFLISRGEYFTTLIMSKFLDLDFVPAEELIIFKNGTIDINTTQTLLKQALQTHKSFATCGFYGRDELGKIRLFSRGGGDFSGALIAKLLNAEIYENWTDVEGIYDINPCICKGKLIKQMSYKQLEFMTSMDTKVIQHECAKLLSNSGIILNIRSCFDLSNSGTFVSDLPRPNLQFACFEILDDTAKIAIQDKTERKTIETDKKDFQKTIKNEYKKLTAKTKT